MTLAILASRLAEQGKLNSSVAPEPGWSSYRQLLAASTLRPGEFADLLAAEHALPRAELATMRGGMSLAGEFSQIFLHEHGLYPYRRADDTLALAIADPAENAAIEAVMLTLGGAVGREIAAFDDIEIALDRGGANSDVTLDPTGEDDGAKAEDVDSLRDLASGAPVVRALEEIFDRAVALRATDIHIEPMRHDVQVRVRVDGVMRTLAAPRGIPLRALISRIKILARMNIAEHRVAQDGRTRIKVRGREFDVRVATMPTTAGEAAILRLLEHGGRLVEFGQLGFSLRDDEVLRRHLTMPHGLIVVTGPTGSGKTTTLAASLALLNDSTRKILTIEDPVEYEIAGIAQSQVRPAVGLTFAAALKAFLRQDPDVMMVGEVRDADTARTAIQAALTGHLVMTTLHTNTAAAAVTRLVDIGVEPFLLASTLTAVVGQRLIRVLCPDCRRRRVVEAAECARNPRLAALGIKPGTVLHEPIGCERCAHAGYRGRRAIFEVLEITEGVRRLMLDGADEAAIETEGRRGGMTIMVEDGLARCLDGVTSLDEVFRVAALRAAERPAA